MKQSSFYQIHGRYTQVHTKASTPRSVAQINNALMRGSLSAAEARAAIEFEYCAWAGAQNVLRKDPVRVHQRFHILDAHPEQSALRSLHLGRLAVIDATCDLTTYNRDEIHIEHYEGPVIVANLLDSFGPDATTISQVAVSYPVKHSDQQNRLNRAIFTTDRSSY